MARTIDYIAFTFILFFLTLVWSTLIFDKWVSVFCFSAAVALIAAFTLWYIRRGHSRPYSHERLAAELSVRGSAYLIGLLKAAAGNPPLDSGANFILLDDCIIFAAFKFGMLTLSDLNALITTAVSHDRKEIYVITRGIDRRAFQLLQFYSVRIHVVKIRALFNYLYKHKALPDLKPVKKHFSWRALADAVFNRSNLKNYLFSGIVLTAVAFLTPLKIYYLVFGSISLLFALLTLTPLGKGTGNGKNAFAQLDAQGAKILQAQELSDDEHASDANCEFDKQDSLNNQDELNEQNNTDERDDNEKQNGKDKQDNMNIHDDNDKK